jgi:hypothetical protein
MTNQDFSRLLDEAFEEAGDCENRASGKKPPKQADVLISLATKADLYHSPDGTGFADIIVDGHRQTWPIKSKAFRRWLARGYYEFCQSAANSEAMTSALNVIEAKAHFDGNQRPFLRVGGGDGKLYLDLCNDEWRAIEIDADGWRRVDEPRCGSGERLDVAAADAGGGRLDRAPAPIPQRQIGCRLRADRRVFARNAAQSRTLSGARIGR